MASVLEYLQTNQARFLHDLRELVEMESPSHDKTAVDRVGATVADWFQQRLGAEVEVIRQPRWGDHLRITVTPRAADEGQVLVLGHFDTVWEHGTLTRLPYREEGDRVYGPGIYDMKFGIVQALWALLALQAEGRAPRRRIVLLFNSEEEVGSPASRPLIEDEARRSRAALVLEPSVGPHGGLKTWRKGVGMFKLRVTGVASHAGGDPEKGRSAIEELARQITELHALTDLAKGTTVNVGVIRGGTRSNVVAAEAEAEIDLRVKTMAEAERVVPLIQARRNLTPGTEVVVVGGLNRPPMEQTQRTMELFALAQGIARELGFEVQADGSGGGSDGNFTAALGVPTLDGLGAVGEGAHADHEHILLSHAAPRTALLAELLARV